MWQYRQILYLILFSYFTKPYHLFMNSDIIINLEYPGNTMQIHKDQMKQMLSKTNYFN